MIYEAQKIMILDHPNKNNHIYSTEAIQEALTRLPEQLVGEFGPSYSNVDYLIPDSIFNVDLSNVSHRVDNLRIEDGYLVGDITTLKTPAGISLESILEEVDFRPRSIGTIVRDGNGNGIITDINIISVDAVMDGA